MLKFVKPTLDQKWDKATGTAGALEARPENGATNGTKGANGSDVTPLFARAVKGEAQSATPPLESSVRSEIQRVRLDLLARETERLQHKLQLILEERRNDREVIDALRGQIEDLTRQGWRMASRYENGESEEGDGDPELEKRIKPLLHTLLRMLERAKKDPEPGSSVPGSSVADQQGLADAPGETETDGSSDQDAWSQIDAARDDVNADDAQIVARQDDNSETDGPVDGGPLELSAKSEAAAEESAISEPQPDPAPAPWYDSDDSDDIPRLDEDFVEIAKLLRSPGPKETSAKTAKPRQAAKIQPVQRQPAQPQPAQPRQGEDPAASAKPNPAAETSGKDKTGKGKSGEPLLLGTELTPQVEARRKAQIEAKKSEAKISEARKTEAGRAPLSGPAPTKPNSAPAANSREVTLRRAAAIADRFGSSKKHHAPNTEAPEAKAQEPKVQEPKAPESNAPELKSASQAPSSRAEPVSGESAATPQVPAGESKELPPATSPSPEASVSPPLEAPSPQAPSPQAPEPEVAEPEAAKPDLPKLEISKPDPAKVELIADRPKNEAQKRVEARAAAIAERTARRRQSLEAQEASKQAVSDGKAASPDAEKTKAPKGSLAASENDPLRAALPKCLTEPWDEGEKNLLGGGGGSLRWPFRKKNRGKGGQGTTRRED